MGLLDEAIREHLELKRKRGEDPTDLAREEHEALGPAVREPTDAAAAPAAAPDEHLVPDPEAPAPPPPVETEAPVAAEEPIVAEETLAGREPAFPAGETGAEIPPPAAESPAAEPEPREEPPTMVEPPPEPDPEPPAPAPPAPDPAATTAQETAVFDVDDVFAEEDAARGREEPREEDVLEETPDFLQETPEHDRLWFEQKPPKDFDFDG